MTARVVLSSDPRNVSPPNAIVVPISAHIRTKRALFGVMRRFLQLPDYFGGNWDALHDCLRDCSWLPTGTEVVLRHTSLPFRDGSPHRATYLELIQSVLQSASDGPQQITVEWPSAKDLPAGWQPFVTWS